MLKMLSPVLILSVACAVSFALIAYDCEDTQVNITIIALDDVAPCADAVEDYKEDEVTIQVIQRNTYKLQRVHSCMVEVFRQIQHCGMHSHTSAVENGLSTFIYPLGAEECRNVHRFKSLRIYNQNIGNILINGTTTVSLTVAGSLNIDSSCEGVTYTENGYTWKKVIITASIKIHTLEYSATVKLQDNTIHLITGISCKFLPGYCIDSTHGETVWDLSITTSCDQTLSQLYKGYAELVINRQVPTEKIIVVEQEEKIFALSLQKLTFLCGVPAYQTEHPQILILFLNNHTSLTPLMPNLPQNSDMFTYINSKLLYVEQGYKREIKKLYRNTVHRRCELHREILKNRLALAPITPNILSSLIKHTLGYVATKMGEVLYIMKCTPKVIKLRKSENCYQELPVWVNNKSAFITPLTHIIQTYAQQIECNRITPPVYLVDGQWTAVTPIHIEQKPPLYLQAYDDQPLKFKSIQQLGARGLYTQEEIKKIQEQLSFGSEREAIENVIARKMKGLQTESLGYMPSQMFDGEEISRLAQSTLRHIYGWFATFGIFFSGIIGIYIVIRIIKYLFGVILNSLTIYQTFGFGFQLLASLWNTLTLWLIHKHTNKAPTNQKQNDEIPVTSSQTEPSPTTSPISSYPNLNHWTSLEASDNRQ